MHTFDINYDPDLESVTILYEGLKLKVRKNEAGQLIFSDSFDEVGDENVFMALRSFSAHLLQEGVEL